MGETRENLWDFWKASKSLTFLSSLPHASPNPTFHKTNILHKDLKKDAINEFGMKHQTLYRSNFRNMEATFTWILKKKYGYLKNTDLKRLTGWLKLCLLTGIEWFHWNKDEKSHPLHLVWWALKMMVNFLLHIHSMTCNVSFIDFVSIWHVFVKVGSKDEMCTR